MGNENIKLGSGRLFIRSVELCEVGDFKIESRSFADDEEYVKIPLIPDIQEATFSGTCTIDMALLLRVTKSNNWLRMHGYPMRRKVRLKRYGKKN
jgi:hypothetical protein